MSHRILLDRPNLGCLVSVLDSNKLCRVFDFLDETFECDIGRVIF